ncbi:MAG: helix-turn-helix transcriptional regulator [Actinobacteria bacterium]|nr:helix-turn-helix transcriptional regulator [Actinomycetota bacterium]
MVIIPVDCVRRNIRNRRNIRQLGLTCPLNWVVLLDLGRWGARIGSIGDQMERTYEDITRRRRARLSPEVRAQSRVLEQAYDIAAGLIGLRLSHGLTQVELADRCGIDQGDISRIERGATSPTLRTL